MADGDCVYVGLWYLHIAVFAVSAFNPTASSFGNIITVHDHNVCFVHGGMWDNWSGLDIGQLAFQHNDTGDFDDMCMYICLGKKIRNSFYVQSAIKCPRNFFLNALYLCAIITDRK